MLLKTQTLAGYRLHSLDGELGKVKDFYFDDHFWTVRYVIANTGNWLTGRQVLLSPYSVSGIDATRQQLDIKLTRQKIEASPTLDSERPVSRQFEDAYYGYYGWPTYWGGSSAWGTYPYMMRPYLVQSGDAGGQGSKQGTSWDPHLRSTHAVKGHHIHAIDGEIGHVKDFVIDIDTWSIRYLVVDTQNWWHGKTVLLAPKWIERISWDESAVYTNLSREAIKQSPEYADGSSLTREYEEALHQHYHREGYWVDEEVPVVPVF